MILIKLRTMFLAYLFYSYVFFHRDKLMPKFITELIEFATAHWILLINFEYCIIKGHFYLCTKQQKFPYMMQNSNKSATILNFLRLKYCVFLFLTKMLLFFKFSKLIEMLTILICLVYITFVLQLPWKCKDSKDFWILWGYVSHRNFNIHP